MIVRKVVPNQRPVLTQLKCGVNMHLARVRCGERWPLSGRRLQDAFLRRLTVLKQEAKEDFASASVMAGSQQPLEKACCCHLSPLSHLGVYLASDECPATCPLP